MSLKELKDRLHLFNIPESSYSINGELKPDAYILFKNYSKWEFFYLDERGGRNDFAQFQNEEDAFDFFWKKIQNELRYPPSVPPKSVGI